MPDMERVIGYLNDCMEASRRDNTWVFVRKDIVEDALALLKDQEERLRKLQKDKDKLCLKISEWKHKFHYRQIKEQEAVEPINSYGIFRCGNCGNIIGYNDGYGRGYQSNFCCECGNAVKWE